MAQECQLGEVAGPGAGEKSAAPAQLALCRRQQRGQDAQQGGLADTVGAHDLQDVTAVDRAIHLLEQEPVIALEGKIAKREQGRRGRQQGSSTRIAAIMPQSARAGQPGSPTAERTFIALSTLVGTARDRKLNAAFQIIANILFNSDGSPLPQPGGPTWGKWPQGVVYQFCPADNSLVGPNPAC